MRYYVVLSLFSEVESFEDRVEASTLPEVLHQVQQRRSNVTQFKAGHAIRSCSMTGI